ncbi:hypothetical protein HK105_201939 [Polyrhizophydium stewartii]|uniref:Tyrosine specific protein phosphatases domain-containing protein n=1 Tax=Polyrhizophydium stewartii TaxID=2732419 RepID=A0ABR4NG84_9FUNG
MQQPQHHQEAAAEAAAAEVVMRQAHEHAATKGHELRTSRSHPINISWMLPAEALAVLDDARPQARAPPPPAAAAASPPAATASASASAAVAAAAAVPPTYVGWSYRARFNSICALTVGDSRQPAHAPPSTAAVPPPEQGLIGPESPTTAAAKLAAGPAAPSAASAAGSHLSRSAAIAISDPGLSPPPISASSPRRDMKRSHAETQSLGASAESVSSQEAGHAHKAPHLASLSLPRLDVPLHDVAQKRMLLLAALSRFSVHPAPGTSGLGSPRQSRSQLIGSPRLLSLSPLLSSTSPPSPSMSSLPSPLLPSPSAMSGSSPQMQLLSPSPTMREASLPTFAAPAAREARRSSLPLQAPAQAQAVRHIVHGNFCLSSCPGKKVRVTTGPVNGRAAVCRDLAADFDRIASVGIRALVCCLDDNELRFLGSPWPLYVSEAHKRGITVIRIPIVEGQAPSSPFEVDCVLRHVDSLIANGAHVLCHCRGGIGRAGLLACCFLIRKGYCTSADTAIRYVRKRRSPKAIETAEQEEFIDMYAQWILKGSRFFWEGLNY